MSIGDLWTTVVEDEGVGDFMSIGDLWTTVVDDGGVI